MTGMQYYPFIYTNGGFRQVTAYIGKNSEESNSFITANNLVFSTKDNLIFVPRDAATKMMKNNSNEVNIQFTQFTPYIFREIQGVILVDNHGRILTNNLGAILIK